MHRLKSGGANVKLHELIRGTGRTSPEGLQGHARGTEWLHPLRDQQREALHISDAWLAGHADGDVVAQHVAEENLAAWFDDNYLLQAEQS